MNRLVVGTSEGVFLLEATASGTSDRAGWEIAAQALEGIGVTAMASSRDRSMLVAGTRRDGVWRSRDSGRNWQRVGEGVVLPNVRALSMLGSGAIYVGTEPAALFRSLDSGDSWEEVLSVRQMSEEKGWKFPPRPNTPAHIRSIATDPGHEETMYLAIQVAGIIRTKDGGKSWTHLTEGFDPDVHALLIDARNPQTVYAATGSGGGYPDTPYPAELPWGRPVYRSTDEGATWECITLEHERTYSVPLCANPQRPEEMFVGVARDLPPHWPERPSRAEGGIMRTRDGGKSWQRLSNGLPDPFLTMVGTIEVDPNEPGRVLLGTRGSVANLPAGYPAGQIFTSGDAGDSWREISVPLPSISALLLS